MARVFVLVLSIALFTLNVSASDEYAVQSIHGWAVHVNRDLLRDDNELGQRALALLQNKLFEAQRVIPKAALERLRCVTIWLDREHEPFPGAVYHPSADWLREHGHNPDMAGGVHIANATNFLNWTREQPLMVVHELSHAYHHQVLGYNHERIIVAFANAVESKKYDSVMRYNGEMQRAYALNNEQEYFAECSEAYFGANDFYPFVRAELKQHDPEIFGLLEQVWNHPPQAK